MNPLPQHPKTAATAPLVQRSTMRALPWFGLLRSLLAAVVANRPTPALPDTAWSTAARQRRQVLLAIVGALAVTALGLQLASAPDDWSALWMTHTVLATLLFAWVGSGFATALMGMWVMLRGDRHALTLGRPHAPIDSGARTAVIMPICNEDIATVFSGLRATCESLAATGTLSLFDFYVLSDTADPALRATEERAWERLRRLLGDDPVLAGGRVFYRWRRRRTQKKAGNVSDFCRRWGRNYRYMVVLDADSTMRGDTLVNMVRLMEEHPRAGIVQTLPQSHGQSTLHARLQQFTSRVTGRLFSLGMAYWQLGESHYWGHNAILRVEPFMRHCALAPIPGRGGLSGHILSHDFVEAALMRRAGYEVWLAPQLEGSWEQHPPNLLDELQRDRRWCQGNLQNARLIAEPGIQPVHRAMFAVGALSYVMAPVWLGFVLVGLATDGGSAPNAALWALTLVLLLLPRALGVLATCLAGEQRSYGGTPRLITSALLELLLSALQAPLRMLAHSAHVLGALTGLRLEWKSPPRDASAVGWRDAFNRIGLLALVALCGFVLMTPGGAVAAPAYLLPMLASLALAVPFTVVTGSPRLGAALQRMGLLTIPDEHRPPAVPTRAIARHGFRDFEAAPAAVPAGSGNTPFGPRRAVAGFAAVATFAVAALLPQSGLGPDRLDLLPTQAVPMVRLDNLPTADALAPTIVAFASERPRRTRIASDKPARMIDNEVRQRAFEAVQRALGKTEESPA